MKLRPAVPQDTPLLTTIADSTGMFKPMEIEALGEVLDDFHALEHANGHFAVIAEIDGRPVGLSYYAPAYMTDHSWYLYWIAVDKTLQRKGVGSELLRKAEGHIRSLGGRLLFIEASSLPH